MAVAVIALASGGCAGTTTPTGTALDPGYGTMYGTAPLRPGDQLGLLDVGMINRSSSPLTISSVTIAGRGVGTVIRIIEVRVAPNLAPDKAVVGGAYQTDPPVDWIGWCRRQVLVPLQGYTMTPRAQARLWVVIQWMRPGRFSIQEHIFTYTQNRTSYQEAIPTGYNGSVARGAPYIPPEAWQARCVKADHARFLANIK